MLFAVFWNLLFVFCNAVDLDVQGSRPNAALLEALFKSKYMTGAEYTEWKEVHDEDTVDLTYICYKYNLLLAGSDRTRFNTGMATSYQNQYMLFGQQKIVELDTLVCFITFVDERDQEVGSSIYHLAEGDEPGTAFAFSLNESSIILEHKLADIWDKNKLHIAI